MKIFTNFYEELETLNENIKEEHPKKYEPITSFNFMENSPIFGPNENEWEPPVDEYGKEINPYDFLHGYCHIFALALHKKFDYPIYIIKDENNETIHYYCKNIIKNEPVYIDVRGITNDLDAFASEFEDWVDKQDIFTHSTLVNAQDIEREIQKENGNEILITASYIINDQPNGYNTNFL